MQITSGKRLYHFFFSSLPRVISPRSDVHTVRSYQSSGGGAAIFARTASKEYRAGFVDSLSRGGDRGPCRARRCQDGVLLRCNRADGETPETVADSRRHRKQLWDLTRRDCRMSDTVFHQVDNVIKSQMLFHVT